MRVVNYHSVISLCLVLLTFEVNSYSATKIDRVDVEVISKIDIVNLYTNAISNVRLIPEQIELINKIDGFESEIVELVVETDIPREVSGQSLKIPYLIKLISNKAKCYERFSPEEQVDFSSTQSVNPTFTTVRIENVGDGNNDQILTEQDNTANVEDFKEYYLDSSSNVEMKKNTHRLNLEFVNYEEIAMSMPSGNVLNTECNGELIFNIAVDL